MKKNDPIRLFVDAHVFDGEFQGTRTFIKEIYTQLALLPDIRLFFGALDTDRLKEVFPGMDSGSFIPYKSHSGIRRLAFDIPSIIKKNKIDYAHFQYITPLTKACRYIVTIHDVIFNEYPAEFSPGYRFSKRLLYQRSAAMSDIITTVSEYSKRSINNFLKVDQQAIHIVPNGVGPQYFEPYDKDRSRRYIQEKYNLQKPILYVSRMEPRKNHAFLLKAFLRLNLYREGFHLVLLGSRSIKTPEFDELYHALSPEVKSFIYINDKVGDNDLLEFYRAAEVFVYPSRAEGFGIPPLEAAALKIPVICSGSSAMEDFTFFAPYHIDPFRYEQLESALSGIIREQPDQSRLQELSGIVQTRYSWRKAAGELYQILMKDKNSTFAKSK